MVALRDNTHNIPTNRYAHKAAGSANMPIPTPTPPALPHAPSHNNTPSRGRSSSLQDSCVDSRHDRRGLADMLAQIDGLT
jgi:hypothetical protein